MSIKFNPITGKFDMVNAIPAETDPVFGASEAASFAAGDKNKLDGIETGAEVNNISDVNATDLTDGGASTLHKHDHGNMDGLSDDDHTGYLTEARHDALPSDNPHSVTKAQVGLTNVNDSSTTNGMWESSGGNTQLKTADDVDFAKYKAIQMCCDNGTSFPASPNTGQWFYRSDIDTLFMKFSLNF